MLLIALAVICARLGFSEYTVAGSSMERTLACATDVHCTSLRADELLVSRAIYWFTTPKRGDIIVFHLGQHGPLLVKRIIGAPGDLIMERRGVWYRNGGRLPEAYVWHADHGSYRRRRVPPGSYFVLGDDRAFSRDSRSFGFISRRWIVGKAILIVSPRTRFRLL